MLLDLGMARGVQDMLVARGIEAVHVGDLEMATATDAELLELARRRGLVVVTTDTGCATMVARSGALAPSVITLRLDDPNGQGQVAALEGLLSKIALSELCCCVVTLERERFRKRALPPLG
jgi:predicted nuclease of predicted toxin-antitoxin system